MRRREPLSNPGPLIRRVYAYVAYRVGDGPDAEDITSAVFERALRYGESYDTARGDSVTWLIGIARRCVADHRPAAHEWIDGLTVASDEDTAGDTVRRLDLRAALARLSEDDRELLLMRFGADLTPRQIAEVLEIKPNAVGVRLHRAVARVRRELERDEPGADALTPPTLGAAPDA